MKLLLTAASLDRATGGPAYSVPALGKAIAARGIDVGIWAADGTRADNAPRQLRGSLGDALDEFGAPDLIHDNGIWLPHNHRIAGLSHKRGIPRVVSLRGMLEPWALRHRRIKKKLAWTLYQRRDLASADLLHATAGIEEDNARALGLRGPFCVIANGVDLPTAAPPSQSAQEAGCRTALFVSRIHPKKGLPMLLRAWARLQQPGWRLQIAGPDEDGHSEELKALIAEYAIGDSVALIGPVYGEGKDELYRGADLFVLPTYSENFGIAVAEALAQGIPALTTTGAPWQSLVTNRCGWWVAPDEDSILEGLRTALTASDAERREMGARGAELVAREFNWSGIAAQFENAYSQMLSARRS